MEKIPDPKELEKELSDYLSNKYGSRIRVLSQHLVAKPEREDGERDQTPKASHINFDLKPEELEAYLNEYVIKQETAKSVLATKVCTHFNRIRYCLEQGRGRARTHGSGDEILRRITGAWPQDKSGLW